MPVLRREGSSKFGESGDASRRIARRGFPVSGVSRASPSGDFGASWGLAVGAGLGDVKSGGILRSCSAALGNAQKLAGVSAKFELEMDFDSVPILCERHGLTFPAM